MQASIALKAPQNKFLALKDLIIRILDKQFLDHVLKDSNVKTLE
jgi:hypothetical protein